MRLAAFYRVHGKRRERKLHETTGGAHGLNKQYVLQAAHSRVLQARHATSRLKIAPQRAACLPSKLHEMRVPHAIRGREAVLEVPGCCHWFDDRVPVADGLRGSCDHNSW